MSLDVEIPTELAQVFTRWINELQLLNQWSIPRNYTGQSWRDVKSVQLHGLEMNDGSCVCSLVMAKTRVAPIKKQTLPRLELLGSLLCARLLVFVRDALKLRKNVEYMCWTDSMVALSWIHSEAVNWKEFFSNGVSCIQELTAKESWFHCPGDENPADLLTRGITAEELINSKLWLQGPSFLIDVDNVKSHSVGVVNSQVMTEAVTVTVCSPGPVRKLFDVER